MRGGVRRLRVGEYAGPVSHEIGRTQIDIDAKLQAQAATGSSAPESTAATMHRQPPHSIGAAESRLGEVSPEKLKAVRAAMVRARSADDTGDQRACERASAAVPRALGR